MSSPDAERSGDGDPDRSNSSDVVEPTVPDSYRAKATGEEAEWLEDAGHRVEAMTSILSRVELGEVEPDDIDFGHLIKLGDHAKRDIERSHEKPDDES